MSTTCKKHPTYQAILPPQVYCEPCLEMWKEKLLNDPKFTFDNYRIFARQTAIYKNLGNNLNYPLIGFIGELNELYHEINGYDLQTDGEELNKQKIEKEFGDVLWYTSNLFDEIQNKGDDLIHFGSFNHFIEDILLLVPTKARRHPGKSEFMCLAELCSGIKKLERGDYEKFNYEQTSEILCYLIDILIQALRDIDSTYHPNFKVTDFVKNVVIENVVKLKSRQLRNQLKGTGGDR